MSLKVYFLSIYIKLLKTHFHPYLAKKILIPQSLKNQNMSNLNLFEFSASLNKNIRYLPFKMVCYDKALLARYWLLKNDVQNQMFIGKKIKTQEFHAWVMVNDFCICGYEVDLSEYQTLICYS